MLFLLLFLQYGSSSPSDVYSLEERGVFAVNCGGPLHIGYGGLVYKADKPTSGAEGGTVGEAYNFTNAHPEERQLYKTERYADDFGYIFPVPEDGNYVLLLKFSEVSFGRPGAKMFHVALNDLLLLNNFDVFRHTRQLGAAYEKRFTFSILNGTMTIRGRRIYVGQQLRLLFHKGKADMPRVNALAVLRGGLEGLPPLPTNLDTREYNYTGYQLTYDDGMEFFSPAQCCQFCGQQDTALHPFHFNPTTVRCSEYFEAEYISFSDYARVLSSYPEECCNYCGEAPADYFYVASKELNRPGWCRPYSDREDEFAPSQCSLCEDLVRMMLKMDTREVDVLKFELKDTCKKAEATPRLCEELIDEHGDTLIIAAHSNISTEAICTYMVKMCDKGEAAYPVKGLLPKRHEYSIVKPEDLRYPADLLSIPELTPINLDQFVGNGTTQEGRRRTLQFLARYGLIRNEMACPLPECSANMSLVEDALEPRWRCEGCRRTNGAGSHMLSVRRESIFQKDNLRLEEVLKTMAQWAVSPDTTMTKGGPSKWFGIFRDICEAWFTRIVSTDKIGGPNKTVHIDEAVTYRGENKQGQRILGAFELSSRKAALLRLENNCCSSFVDALKRVILPGSTLIFDNWTDYCAMPSLESLLNGDGSPKTGYLIADHRRVYYYTVSLPDSYLKYTLTTEPNGAPENIFIYWFRRYHEEKIMNQLLFEMAERYGS